MKNPLIGGVRFINDLFLQDCLRCRYYPTCSQYMIDAIHTWKCQRNNDGGSTDFTMSSFVKGGIDYVPLKFRLTKILMRPIMDRIRIEEIRKQK